MRRRDVFRALRKAGHMKAISHLLPSVSGVAAAGSGGIEYAVTLILFLSALSVQSSSKLCPCHQDVLSGGVAMLTVSRRTLVGL